MAEELDYSKVAFEGSWKARTRGMIGVAAVGLLVGLTFGLLAPLIPAVAGLAAFEASVIPSSMAIFGAFGLATGAMVGAVVGEPSGAVSAVVKEMEKRNNTTIPTVISKESKIENPRKTRYFNPKVGAVFAAFGALCGVVMAAGFLASGAGAVAAVPALTTILGASAGSTAATTAYFVGVMTMAGGLMGINFPKITSEAQDFTGKLLSGKLLGASWEKEQGKAIIIEKQCSIPENTTQLQPASVVGKHTSKVISERPTKTDSYRELVSSANSQDNLGVAVNM